MAYCTTNDIQNEFKDVTFSASTSVTSTDVSDFITTADAVINGYLASKYSTPITGSASLAIVKMISIWLVKSRILSILSVKSPQAQVTQEPDGASLYKQAMGLLKDIKSGAVQLSDATMISSNDGLVSYLMDEDITHDYSRQENDW